jgi:AcrR family transcriptional regulator
MSHEEDHKKDTEMDLRVRRTHKLLQEAMIELITEKGFDAITVGDIAERAMINRATFYRHYQDKYDLVMKIFEETVGQLVTSTKPSHGYVRHLDPENPPELWLRLFEHFAEHARLYRAMLGKNGSSWYADRVREYAVSLILERERERQHHVGPTRQNEPAMPQELPAILLSHVLIGAIVWWLESENSYTPKQIATWFLRFMLHGYVYARGFEAHTLPDKS